MRCMNIDSTVVFHYILPLHDHPIVCDWAKIVSKIGRNFAAFCRSHCSKLASAAAAKCGIMRVSPPPKLLQLKFRPWNHHRVRMTPLSPRKPLQNVSTVQCHVTKLLDIKQMSGPWLLVLTFIVSSVKERVKITNYNGSTVRPVPRSTSKIPSILMTRHVKVE